ncbi:MAG: hypothetical protein GY788_00190 [bacterium]|nr:hypothetical protein [bacterium]
MLTTTPPSRPRGRTKLAIGLFLVTLAASSCGTTSTHIASAAADPVDVNASGDITPSSSDALFGAALVHQITLSFGQEAYDAMIETYGSTGSKEWIEATVIIDGTTYENAGIRLKGNSSLFGLGGDGQAGGPGGNANADEPEGLPWLIRLNKYIDNQNHQGIFDLVVRSSNSESALNEAVALELLELAGLASQDAIYVSFSINGSDPTLRLVIEHPDDVWLDDAFSDAGALYKAESTGDYSYRGDDPDAYDEVFDQEAGEENEDLSPLIEFLDLINNADDATFYAELDERLDTDALATYLAMQELIDNFDDIDGPGNNSYLYYNSETSVITVVPWDHNLAFGVVNGGEGGFDGPPAGAPPQPPEGTENVGGPGGSGGSPAGSNILAERFLADSGYEALYQQKLEQLTESLYDSGVASGVLASWMTLLEEQASGLIDDATISSEAETIAVYFDTGS